MTAQHAFAVIGGVCIGILLLFILSGGRKK